jgi:DNA polymerase III sliding clamp (beta) subunit (PCNA family)
MLLLPRNLAGLAKLCAAESARFSMTGVHVLEYQDRYRLEATDGKRLIIVQGEKQDERTLNYADSQTAQTLAEASDGCFDYVVPADAWTRAFRLPIKERKQESSVGLVASDNRITLAVEDGQFAVQPVEGKYPNCKEVIPRKPATFTIRVNARLLADVLLATAALTSEPDHPSVDLLFWDKSHPFGIQPAHPSAGYACDALLMPLT